MPSGWDAYYVFFLSALLSLGVPAFLKLISMSKRRGQPRRAAQADATGWDFDAFKGRRINTRFFMGTNVALILTALCLALVPCVGAIPATSGIRLVAILSICVLSALALLYAATKGDLDWL